MEQQSLRTDDCTEKVIRYYSDMVYRLAFARTGTRHDADDIFQEVFLRYVKKSRYSKRRNIERLGLFELQ